ncbi:MAG: hypothetical protein ACLFVK_02195 [Dehalococcoidia bacterium]
MDLAPYGAYILYSALFITMCLLAVVVYEYRKLMRETKERPSEERESGEEAEAIQKYILPGPSWANSNLPETLQSLQTTVQDLAIRLDRMEYFTDRLSDLEKQVSNVSTATEGLPQDMHVVVDSLEQLVGEIGKIHREIQNSFGYDMRRAFKCNSCGAEGLVLGRVKCSQCGSEGWWGWWPEPEGGEVDDTQHGNLRAGNL